MNVKELLQNKKLLAAIAALLVVVLLICLVGGGNKAEKTVENYIKYNQKEKAEKLYKTLPRAMRSYLKEEDEEEDFIEYLEENCESFNDYYDDCKFDVLKVVKMAEDDLEDYQDMAEDIADAIDGKFKVQAGKYVVVMVTDEDGYVSTRVYDVLKINGSWVVASLIGL